MFIHYKTRSHACIHYNKTRSYTGIHFQMNKGMIHGTEIRVDFASDDNGFIELPPEAASQPWARIGITNINKLTIINNY